MAFKIVNGIKSQMQGIGIADNVVTGTARPTTDATVAATSTASLTTAINRGKVHVEVTSVDVGVKIASCLITLSDNTPITAVVESIASFNPAAADQIAGQGLSMVVEFCTDLNIVLATAHITPSGTKATTSGAIEYQVDIEMAGESSNG